MSDDSVAHWLEWQPFRSDEMSLTRPLAVSCLIR